MKKLLLILLYLPMIGFGQTTATNFTTNDCNGAYHNLFDSLDAGNVIVISWVMPCTACATYTLPAYSAVQTFATSHPGRVHFYLADDYANTPCATLINWGNSYNMPNSTFFSSSDVNMSDYGTAGMPKVVVLGGDSHTIYYNENNSQPTFIGVQNAIANALVLQTYVPDDNFEAYLETNGMGNGIANDDYVTTANVNTVTNLNVSGNNISDLTGIEAFTALTYLYCGYNQLSSLDVSQNTALTFLNCSTNVLSSLDVSSTTALTDLECGHNQLTNLDLSQNTSLTYLYCWENQLTSLDVRNGNNTALDIYTQANPNLFCIDVDDPVWSATNWTGIDPWSSFSYSCGGPQTYVPDNNFEAYLEANGIGNGISNDDSVFTHNINTLTFLDINNQNISDLTGIEDFTALTDLNCYDNQLTSIDVSNNTSLTSLSCGSNQLTSIDVSNNIALTTLSCDGNQLASLDLNYNTAIRELSVGFNNPMIIDFSMLFNLESLWFYNLLELDLSNNSMLVNLGSAAGGNYQNLSYVNIQNGNNVNLTCDGVLPLSCGSFRNHPDLTCIQVDDVTWANTNWIDNITWNGSPAIDTTFQYFSTNCGPPTLIEEYTTYKELIKVIDLLGRETKGTKNEVLFQIFDDGTVEKRIVIE